MSEGEKRRLISPMAFGDALVAAGVMSREEMLQTRRVVIDCCAYPAYAVTVYTERYADEQLLGVLTSLGGIEITGSGLHDRRLAELLKEAKTPLDQILLSLGYIVGTYGTDELKVHKQGCTMTAEHDIPEGCANFSGTPLQEWGKDDVRLNDTGKGYDISDAAAAEIARVSFGEDGKEPGNEQA